MLTLDIEKTYQLRKNTPELFNKNSINPDRAIFSIQFDVLHYIIQESALLSRHIMDSLKFILS